jgi:hypothetical protein
LPPPVPCKFEVNCAIFWFKKLQGLLWLATVFVKVDKKFAWFDQAAGLHEPADVPGHVGPGVGGVGVVPQLA